MQQHDLAAGQERSGRPDVAEVAEVDVAGGRRQRKCSQRRKPLGSARIDGEESLLRTRNANYQVRERVRGPQKTRAQGGHAAGQVDGGTGGEVTFAVIGEDVERASAARRYHQVGVALSGEISTRQEIRAYGHEEGLRIRQEGRGELAAADALERSVALRSESVEVAAIDGDGAAVRRAVADYQVGDAVAIQVSRD